MPFTEATLSGWVAKRFDAAAESQGLTGGDLMRSMEECWNRCVRAYPAPDFIMVTPRFARVVRRSLLPPRVQIGGSSARAIKRRAVRRPW